MPCCAECSNRLAEKDIICNLCGVEVVGNKPRSNETDGMNKKGAVAFYIVVGAMIIWWLYSGMPTNRFWWR